jgi:hypothetical protein
VVEHPHLDERERGPKITSEQFICVTRLRPRSGPLRGVDAATSEQGAHPHLYVAVGEVTDPARAFAAKKGIGLVGDEELARLLAK